MMSLYGLLADYTYNDIPKFRCNVYLTLIKSTYVVHYLEYFYSSCMEKSSGHSFFFFYSAVHYPRRNV